MRYRYQVRDRIYDVSLERRSADLRLSIDGQAYDLSILDAQPGEISLLIMDRPVRVFWAVQGNRIWLSLNGCAYRLDPPTPRTVQSAGEPAAGSLVRSPMPAQVRLVQVAEGDTVEKGQTLLLLEAMKMEIRLRAPADGTIKRLLAANGQAVEKDQVLVEITQKDEG